MNDLSYLPRLTDTTWSYVTRSGSELFLKGLRAFVGRELQETDPDRNFVEFLDFCENNRDFLQGQVEMFISTRQFPDHTELVQIANFGARIHENLKQISVTVDSLQGGIARALRAVSESVAVLFLFVSIHFYIEELVVSREWSEDLHLERLRVISSVLSSIFSILPASQTPRSLQLDLTILCRVWNVPVPQAIAELGRDRNRRRASAHPRKQAKPVQKAKARSVKKTSVKQRKPTVVSRLTKR